VRLVSRLNRCSNLDRLSPTWLARFVAANGWVYALVMMLSAVWILGSIISPPLRQWRDSLTDSFRACITLARCVAHRLCSFIGTAASNASEARAACVPLRLFQPGLTEPQPAWVQEPQRRAIRAHLCATRSPKWAKQGFFVRREPFDFTHLLGGGAEPVFARLSWPPPSVMECDRTLTVGYLDTASLSSNI